MLSPSSAITKFLVNRLVAVTCYTKKIRRWLNAGKSLDLLPRSHVIATPSDGRQARSEWRDVMPRRMGGRCNTCEVVNLCVYNVVARPEHSHAASAAWGSHAVSVRLFLFCFCSGYISNYTGIMLLKFARWQHPTIEHETRFHVMMMMMMMIMMNHRVGQIKRGRASLHFCL